LPNLHFEELVDLKHYCIFSSGNMHTIFCLEPCFKVLGLAIWYKDWCSASILKDFASALSLSRSGMTAARSVETANHAVHEALGFNTLVSK
jgi:hypothetical protein